MLIAKIVCVVVEGYNKEAKMKLCGYKEIMNHSEI